MKGKNETFRENFTKQKQKNTKPWVQVTKPKPMAR